MSHRPTALVRAACTVIVFTAWALAQTPANIIPRIGPNAVLPNIRVDSDLVLIPVSVTDSRNRPVTGLPRNAFRIFDDKTEQPVIRFDNEDAPASVGIVFDSSGSMKDKLSESREAVARFVERANPEDEFFLVNFASQVQLAAPFTPDGAGIANQLLYAESNGRTALLDAVCRAMDYMKKASHARRALLVISDGRDNFSRYTKAEILDRVRESDLWIYTIEIDAGGGLMLPEADRGETLMQQLAEESGGRYFAAESARELPAIAAQIGLELRDQYVIGYRPSRTGHDGKYHHVHVKLTDSRGLRATWRPGYYRP
jgi:Ca-activated chloride channel family protein